MLRGTGVTALRWRFLKPDLYCFNFHRIGEKRETAFDPGVFSCSQECFREHVALLATRFEIISVERLIELRSHSQRAARPLALITFDDGYGDNYNLAFPVLKQYGVAATFFIPTAFIESRTIPWWDEIAWLVRNASTESIRLEGDDRDFPVGANASDVSIMKILQVVRRRPMTMADQVQEIRDGCKVSSSCAMPADSLFMTWDQLKEMHDAGMGIGSHTHTHPILSTLSCDAQREELAISKSILEERLKAPVKAVAYPVGSRSAFTPETCTLAKSVGYELGFSFRRHQNALPLSAPYEIGRFAVDGEMTPARFRSLVAFPSI